MPKIIYPKSSLDPAKLEFKRNSTTYRAGHSLLITESVRIQDDDSDPLGLMPLGTLPKADTRYKEKKLVEDITHNALDDFELKPIMDCRYQAAQVVKAINFHHGKTAENRARREFLDQLEAINICQRCRCPIKVKKAVELLREKQQVEDRFKVLVRTPYGWGKQGYRITHYKWEGERVKTYVDIPAHYEWWNPDGEKAFYFYVDGTGRDIRLERIPVPYKRPARKYWERKEADADGMVVRTRFKERFVQVLEDGSKVPVIPEAGYRLFNIRCECEFRRRRQAAARLKV